MQVRSLAWEGPLEEGMANEVFLPGESQGQRRLADYSPWCCKESDTAEVTEHACIHLRDHIADT